jgi:hypothetical protein
VGIRFEEVERLARVDSPELVDAITALLDESGQDDDTPLPEGAFTLRELLRLINGARRQWRDENERQTKVQEAWTRFLSQSDAVVPPRF